VRFYIPSNVFGSLEDHSYIADVSNPFIKRNSCNGNFCFLLL